MSDVYGGALRCVSSVLACQSHEVGTVEQMSDGGSGDGLFEKSAECKASEAVCVKRRQRFTCHPRFPFLDDAIPLTRTIISTHPEDPAGTITQNDDRTEDQGMPQMTQITLLNVLTMF